MGLFGPPNIEKMKARRDVEGLIKALSYEKDASVRSRAAFSLGEIRDARAVNPLIFALGDKELETRKAAAEALGWLGDSRAVEPLMAALQDKELPVRRAAVAGLGQIGDARAVAPLIAALKDKDVREAAAKALGKIGTPVVGALITALKDENESMCRAAAETLGQIGDARAVEPLIMALEDENVRRVAAGALGKLGTPAVKPLIGMLEAHNSLVRREAAETLDKLGWKPGNDESAVAYWIAIQNKEECVRIGTPVVERLIAILKEENWYARKFAADTLGEIGDARAVKPLIATIKDRHKDESRIEVFSDGRRRIVDRDMHKDVHRSAVEALGKIRDVCAVEALIAALKDQHKDVRMAANKALKKIGWKPGEDEATITYWIARQDWDECVRIGAPAIGLLLAALKDRKKDVRRGVAETLEKIGWKPGDDEVGATYWIARQDWDACVRLGAPAVGLLLAALKDRKKDVRRGAAEALEKIGWKPGDDEVGATYWIARQDWDACVRIGVPAVGLLIAALKDEDVDVCIAAATTLEKIGAPAVEPLNVALKDKDEHVRRRAAETLGQIGDPRATETLIAALEDEYVDVRMAGVKALVQIGAPAVEPLIAALKDRKKVARMAAAETLGQIGDARAVAPLIAELKDKDVRDAAAKALGKIGAPAVGTLIAALKDEDTNVRRAAAETLGQIGDTRALESLIAALRDEIPNVRASGAEALGQIGDTRAVESLIAALEDKDANMREAAANGLGRIGDAHAVEPLIAALKDRDYDVREAVAWALGQIGDTRAVEPLLATLKDENKGVQESAAKALVKLHETRKLNQEHKQLLLAHRSVFPEAWHEDRTYHEDDACTRYYYEQHEDKSGGVQFPL